MTCRLSGGMQGDPELAHEEPFLAVLEAPQARGCPPFP
jgi:hypothetical protein